MCALLSSLEELKGSLLFEKDVTKNRASEIIISSCTNQLLDHEASYECSLNPCMECVLACRRSPRLLTNGYYILSEDSFLFDEDGNVTLSPSQTNVTYKEKIVRIFRKRKRIRRSLVSLFNRGTSKSWLNSTMVDLPSGEDTWFEGDSKMDENQCSDNGTVDFALGQAAEKAEGYRKTPNTSSPSTEFSTVRNDLFPMLMLTLCLMISLGVRFFLGELFTALLACSLLIIVLICKQIFSLSSINENLSY
uniref:Transmembrane protein 71 isoform X1 n=2 Tax=Pogona vitticeps TaxID=103695 RepID=A0ABM5GCS9_9SAUR